MAKPFLKWVGGKRSLLPELLVNLPEFDSYYEPMVGGGALFFKLQELGRLKNRFVSLSDVNEILIKSYTDIRDSPESILGSLRKHRLGYENTPEKYYYAIRKAFNIHPTVPQFLFLNKTGFNGLYRVNRKGELNTPWGKYEKPNIVDYERIRGVSTALQYVSIQCTGFSEQLAEADANDLVYLDPPYFGTFKGYTKQDVKDFDFHELLEKEASKARDRGVHVMLSNSGGERMQKLYSNGWNVQEVAGRRSISCNGEDRKPKSDLLIRSW